MVTTRRAAWAVLAVGFAALAAACGADGDAGGRMIAVPGDAPTIQEAVDRARRGDVVLVEPGTYHEAVVIDRPGITLRGADRNEVVLDGHGELSNGVEVVASGVAVENLTVTGFRFNGVIVNGADGQYRPEGAPAVDGYRVGYVTAYNNGLYGVYAFGATNGEITDSYASGHPDSGFYVGQCKPCNAVLRNVTAEHNAIGYFGTNASGGVYVVESTFVGNRLGIAPNSQDTELLAPQVETVVAGNFVSGAGAERAPEIRQGFYGGGIAIGGGTDNLVARNRVVDHVAYGIGLVALGAYDPSGNRVEGNVLERNAIDLLYAPSSSRGAAGNCFTGNTFGSSAPGEIEAVMPCGAAGTNDVPSVRFEPPAAPPGPARGEVPAPPPQPSMPDPRGTRVPVTAPQFPVVADIGVPTDPR